MHQLYLIACIHLSKATTNWTSMDGPRLMSMWAMALVISSGKLTLLKKITCIETNKEKTMHRNKTHHFSL